MKINESPQKYGQWERKKTRSSTFHERPGQQQVKPECSPTAEAVGGYGMMRGFQAAGASGTRSGEDLADGDMVRQRDQDQCTVSKRLDPN